MKDLLTPELLAAVFALLQNPSTYCWAVLLVAGLWVLCKLCTAVTELVKLFKPSK
jgi:hypothetical protein